MTTPRPDLEKRDSALYPSAAASTVISRTPSVDSELRIFDGEATPHHIDVAQAKADFDTLERTLTKAREDLEKADPEEEFNLRDYFTNSNNANLAHGIRPKHVGVTWENLQVEVPETGHKTWVRSLPHAVYDTLTFPFTFTLSMLKYRVQKEFHGRPIIRNFDGVVKPGEICLVLGVPGSGCSTFLKVIANQRGEFWGIKGDVEYAGISAAEMSKRYAGETMYNPEDDIHIPTLTVEQTLQFALSTKTPSKRSRLPGVSAKEFDKEVLDTLLKMLNITHARNTLVGNEYIRGVSGGERKRVSILEMMATRAHVVSYDNSTRGLDASTALDFVKGLRVTTDILGQTTFVSLYQAGEGIYNLVDKVLVIDQGRTVYFGPAEEARQYFTGLGFKDKPRQATADYLTGCTDPNERVPAPGANPPNSPDALEAAFRSSEHFKRMVAEREDYQRRIQSEAKHEQDNFRHAVREAKKSDASEKSVYTLGFVGQVKALTKRQFTLQYQDKFTLVSAMASSWVLAIILGAVYINLPKTTFGGFIRGSILFYTILANTLDAFAELPSQMMNRSIFFKQRSYKLFSPSALSVANTIADLPFSAIRVFIFNVIVYFMTDLHRSGGGFWTFHLFNYLCFLTLQGCFRTIGILLPNFDAAFRITALVIPMSLSYMGYLIPRADMRKWMFWLYYLDPMAYTWSGLMESEFRSTDLLCSGTYITPRNAPGQTTYPEGLGPNQVCTFFGAQPGNPIVNGRDYINVAFDLKVADLWRRNFVVLLVFFLWFQLTQAIAMEYVISWGSSGVQVFIKETKKTKKLNERLAERHLRKATRTEERSEFKRGKALTWKDVNYVVPVPGGTRRLLHNITGYVKSGQLVALMGASGAGKTTCLDVLAQRKNIGVITGEILLEGRPLHASFARETAYAEQMDVHEPTTTVREAMRFSAYLRQPFSVPKEEKDDYVESIIELLELQDLSEALVLTLGVEARKRLTIGVELASRPSALLFLDEPTSGLDAQSAFNLVRFLRKLAAAGQSIICTIHQPSALLFENFDRLLLLEKGGETVYFGDIGADSEILRDYLARNGATCPHDVNPAEFMLEAIGAGSSKRIGPTDWKDIWLASPEFATLQRELEILKVEAAERPEEETSSSTYATPMWYQTFLVSQRALYALWRSPEYTWTRVFIHIFLSLVVSLTYLNFTNSVRDLQSRVFSMFWACILPALVVNQIIPAFIVNRMIFIREASSGMYSPVVFAIGQVLAETPWSLVCAICYWVLMYFPQHLGQGASGRGGGSGYMLLMVIAVEMFGVTLGQAVGALAPNIPVAMLTNTPFNILLTTWAGVPLPYPQMHKFWRSWLYQLTPYTRVIAGMTVTELQGLEVVCRPDEFAVFDPPAGQTCAQWAGEFVNNFGGYLQNGNATSACQYCQYKVGQEFFIPLNMSWSHRWRDLGIVFGYFGFNVLVIIVASKYLRYARR